MELLTSTQDESHKTVCLYSMGNCVSNQRDERIDSIPTAHTEDGVLFSITFAKYSDGTVLVEGVELLPLWVNLYEAGGKKVYQVLPLDTHVADWKTAFSLTNAQLKDCQDSYDRTMALVGAGLEAANQYYAEHQAAVEAALGVEP